jgi:NADPH2:quinone reductase
MTAAPALAQAIQMTGYGGPEVLRWVGVVPAPLAADEVRFRVLAAAVNRADLEIRAGNWPVQAAQPFPYTPGLEALGDVIEVGSAVRQVKPGDRVITMMQKLGGIHGVRPGGYQEFVAVRADAVAVVPHTLDPLALAALGLAAVTAGCGIAALQLQPGYTVVIHGASGGVGSAAVAAAKALGTRVLATSTSRGKDDYLRTLGADAVIHLGDGKRLLDEVAPRSVDAVLELTGQDTFADSVAVLRRGGRLCLLGAASGPELRLSAWDLLHELVLTGYSSENLTGDALRASMKQLCSLLEQGKLSAPPYRSFAMAQAAQAHALMEQGAVMGRALLVPG